MLRLFVGYDSEQPLASAVFAFSAQRRCSKPLTVMFLNLNQLKLIFRRPREDTQSTEFAFTRFLVPYLCDYRGKALFVDGDMLCRSNIAWLFDKFDDRYAVQVVKRDQGGLDEEGTKFLGRKQLPYPRKNWSSVMLFNNERCMALTPEYVGKASGLDLHQFAWTRDELIGDLPKGWNHLVGVDKPAIADIAHYTLGMPTWQGGNDCEYAQEWRDERDQMMKHVGVCYALRG